jgi:hypothetical protein
MTDHSIKRDRWDRPYVTSDGGPLHYAEGRKTPANGVAYTRISTLAGALDDKGNLIDWCAANAAIGVVRDGALHAQIAHLASAHPDPWNVPAAKSVLRPLVERAQQAAGSDDGAGLGTAFHGLTELVDTGRDPEYVPDQMAPWLDAYRDTMADWEVLDVETFVVVDALQAAGSMDRLLRHRISGRVVAADIKTGRKEPEFPLKVTVQDALYANGQRYDQRTGARAPLHPDVDLEHGLMIHVPIRSGGQPRCVLYPLDLSAGWELAQLAVRVREARRMPKLEAIA